MIGLLIFLATAYYVVLRRRNDLYFCALLVVFAVVNLPSELKSYFVLQLAGLNVFPQDLLLLVGIVVLLRDPKMLRRATADTALLAIVVTYLAYQFACFVGFSFVSEFQLDYLRMTLFGALWILLVLFDFGPLGGRNLKPVGWAFTAHNIIVLIGAAALILVPGSNDIDSSLASFVGFSSTGSDEGSLILVSALSGVLAVISVWYQLYIEKLNLLAPRVVLAVLVVIVSSHRIDYAALALLLSIYLVGGRWVDSLRSQSLRTALYVFGYVGTSWFLLGALGLSFSEDIATPFVDRAISLFTGSQLDTVSERFAQYWYFYDSYIRNQELTRYLFGEAFLPTADRDDFYQIVQPHNFVVFTFLNNGAVGAFLLLVLTTYVLVVRKIWRARAFLPLALLMITQLTDSGFTHFPISAYFAILLSLCLREREEVPNKKPIAHRLLLARRNSPLPS